MQAVDTKRMVSWAVGGAMVAAVGMAVAQYTPGYTPPQPPQPPTMQPQQQAPGYSWDPGAGVQQQQVQYPPQQQQQPTYSQQQPQYQQDYSQQQQPQYGQPQYGQQTGYDPQQAYGQQQDGQAYGQEIVQMPRMDDRQLADITASIALYPDPLLAIMMPGGTNVQEIAYAQKWMEQHPGADEYTMQQLPVQGSTKALMHYPTVLKLMSDHLDWSQAIGVAFQYQRDDLMQAVQVWRVRAVTAGSLGSTREQVVLAQGNTILILPRAERKTVFVPVYDPQVVYYRHDDRPRDSITFTGGGGMNWLNNDVDWQAGQVYVPKRDSDYGHRRWEEPRVAPDAMVVEEDHRPAIDLNFVISSGKEKARARAQQAPPPQPVQAAPQPGRQQPPPAQPPAKGVAQPPVHAQPQPAKPAAPAAAVQAPPGKQPAPMVVAPTAPQPPKLPAAIPAQAIAPENKVQAPPAPADKKVFVRDTVKPGLINPRTIVTPDKKVVEAPATQPHTQPKPRQP